MRMALIGITAVTLLASIDVPPASAQFSRRFCSQGGADESSGEMDCSFNTWEQCRAAASGLGRYCIENPELLWRERGWGGQETPRRKTSRQRDR
jgi:hypothetical protein